MVSLLKLVTRVRALSDQVYQTLRTNVANGQILSGAQLQETQLAAHLGVSRTPVCEAPTRLASEGLVASDGRSFAVPSLTLADVDDIYEVRLLREPEAVRHVAELAPDIRARAAIQQTLDNSVTADRAGDYTAFIAANARFRSAWIADVPNLRLVHAMDIYADHVQHPRTPTPGRGQDAQGGATRPHGYRQDPDRRQRRGGDISHARAFSEARHAFIATVGLELIEEKRKYAKHCPQCHRPARRGEKHGLQSKDSLWRLLEHAFHPLAGQPVTPAQRRTRRLCGAPGTGQAQNRVEEFRLRRARFLRAAEARLLRLSLVDGYGRRHASRRSDPDAGLRHRPAPPACAPRSRPRRKSRWAGSRSSRR